MSALYDDDIYTWAKRQADTLRRRSANEIDWDNVAEEIESVGRSEARELESRYTVLLVHLLKRLHQPDRRSAGWEITIAEQRRKIQRHPIQNLGLKPIRDDLFAEAYASARAEAALETGLSMASFAVICPFSIENAEDPAFWPDAQPG
jgi:hypothetical protein